MQLILAIIIINVVKLISLLCLKHFSNGKTFRERGEDNRFIFFGIMIILSDVLQIGIVTAVAALAVKKYLL